MRQTAYYWQAMPTVGERLATLEQIARDARREITEIHAAINGGEGVEWNRSVRGRLHQIENTLAGQRLHRAATGRAWSRWQKVLLAVAAVVAAIAPYLVPLIYAHP